MSLDVYLTMPGARSAGGSGIFIRENGRTREISREEWDERFPGTTPIVATKEEDSRVHSGNITHNLNVMADKAGLYEALWRPDELGITHARDLIEKLEEGLTRLKADPTRYKTFNPKNGWGSYEVLVEFVEEYLQACKLWPQAEVSAWR